MGDAAAESKLQPELECDLIMRGGITSGVVFPKAITRLSQKYRFVNIGGTSAGSIAAVMAAAAEYRRATGATASERDAGFAVIDGMADDLARSLKTLFQPSPLTRPLFLVAMAVIASGGKLAAFLTGSLRAYGAAAVLSAMPGVILTIHGLRSGDLWATLLGLLLLAALPVVAVAVCLWRAVTVVLPAHDFGICTGLRIGSSGPLAFTDWIAKKLDEACGRDPADVDYKPLTAGDLGSEQIKIASVTTDLSSGRPYQLPLGTKIFSFRKSEFARLFPCHIVRYLTDTGGRHMKAPGSSEPFTDAFGNDDYYKLPVGDEFPVLLVARLSLSFPGLISAVPLYRFDNTVKDASGRSAFVRCLFSDGGITSNFPIHFFDSLLPGRPTFGISLGSVDKRNPLAPRVFMPVAATQGGEIPAHPVTGLLSFTGAILDTARNWQDSLQSRLHGYRERIVEIRLDDETEGGLNLDMDEPTIQRLTKLGDEAAALLTGTFDFEEHRWRRAVTALPALGKAVARFSEVWTGGSRAHLMNYQPKGLVGLSQAERQRLVDFGDLIAAAGTPIVNKPLPQASRQRATARVVASIATDD